MRGFPYLAGAALAAAVAFAVPASAQDLAGTSFCCDKVCEGTTSTRCGDVLSPSGLGTLSGCAGIDDQIPDTCIGGQLLDSTDMVLLDGCTCVLAEEVLVCFGPLGPAGGQLTPEDCTAEAVRACEEGGNVVVEENDADCGGGGGPVCGNDVCEAGETPENCPDDCPAGPECGDGVCDEGEVCPEDCDTETHCGDGVDNDGDGKADCDDRDCFKNRSGGGDDTNPGGGGNPEGFCNPGGSKK